jgi:hypothetical protein
MDSFTLAMISIGVSANLISFLFGAIYGRHTAYKVTRTFQTADTHVDIRNALKSKSGKIP